MQMIRPPAVAGLFYPATAVLLRQAVQTYVKAAHPDDPNPLPKALIAPHAGYPYSGPIAGSAYVTLATARETIRRVILLGPAHRVYTPHVAMPAASAFETPLGEVPVDRAALDAIAGLKGVTESDDAHVQEHGLEVHLPFLQVMLDTFSIVPLVVGDVLPECVMPILQTLWGGPETLLMVSSDLSHYRAYDAAQKIDCATSSAILNLEPERIGPDAACGHVPIRALLGVAHDKNMRVTVLDQRNSGETAGSRDSVVGYGAYAFYES